MQERQLTRHRGASEAASRHRAVIAGRPLRFEEPSPMVLVNRHPCSEGGPFRATLRIRPASRIQPFDVRGRLLEEFGPDFTRYPRAFYVSDHTTAGYLDRGIARVLDHDGDNIQDYLQVLQKLFPPGAGYVHDQLHLRSDLSDRQRATEPRNGDSHLMFMGGGLRNCASHEQRAAEPVWFVDLDGVHAGGSRTRHTTVIAYHREQHVRRLRVRVEASQHPVHAQNLRDPRLGLISRLQDLVDEHEVAFGRLDVSLPPEERHAGLTVNEYETLLMTHDLRDVLRNPLRFMARMGQGTLQAPLSIPAEALNDAQYDAVQLFNGLMDRVGMRPSLVERLVNRALAVPVSHFLRMKRRIGLPVLDPRARGVGQIGWGTYQSPILIQWRAPGRATRTLDITVVRFA